MDCHMSRTEGLHIVNTARILEEVKFYLHCHNHSFTRRLNVSETNGGNNTLC